MPERLHLSPKHRAVIEALLQEYLPGVEVWAYGSRVHGRNHDGSDLDLVLRGPASQEIPVGQVGDFQEAVRESSIPFLVEARDWARLPEQFHREIEQGYVMLSEENQVPDKEQLFAPLPEDWEYTTLRAACNRGSGDIQTGPFGSQLHASDYVPSGIPSIMPQNIGDNRINVDGIARITPDDAGRLSRYLVREGDIVYSRRGDIERRALVREPEDGWLCGTGCLRVRFGENGVDPKYASYFLGHPDVREWIVRHAHGATMRNLNTSILAACPFVIPPKEEQRAIAHILGTLDDKIELNRRMNETLEAMARAIFKDWFVDFGPTRTKAEGRAPYLPSELWDLFPDALDDEARPEGWSFAPLTALAEVNPESWSKKNTPEEVEYVDLANTKWGAIETTQRFRWQDAPSRAKRILRPGDTIVGMVRPGNGSYAFVGGSGLTGSTGFAVLRPRHPRYTEIVFLSATAPENIERLANLADGAAYPAVRPDVVGMTDVTIGQDAVATSFSALVSPILDHMESNKRENQTLAKTRDLLLPKLMSGEIRLREAEKAVEAVT